MCGIAGYIGKSKKPKVTYDLMTNIFAHLESRGTDAAGIWGLESKNKPKVIYHKAPIKSSEFIQIPIWQKVQNLNPNLLLIHARRTSPGIGHARYNENNHPFVSEDRRIGVIHNGKIHEASFLEDKYETQTDCDSEILLRMYENAIQEQPINIENIPTYMQERLGAVNELWSVLKQGSCAAMVGEIHIDGSRTIMLFRNEKRPLWVADLRESLGQIFFFSSTDIWHQALTDCDNVKEIGYQKLAEIPTNEVWGFKIDEGNQIVNDENFHRIKMKVDHSITSDWNAGTKKIPIQKKKMNLSVITDLDEKGNAPYQVPPKNNYVSSAPTLLPNDDYKYDRWGHGGKYPVDYHDDYKYDRWGHGGKYPVDYHDNDNVYIEELVVEEEDTMLDDVGDDINDDFDDDRIWMQDHEREDTFIDASNEIAMWCEEIKRTIDQIETNFTNSGIEGNLTEDDYSELINSLEQTHRDLEGTAHFFKI